MNSYSLSILILASLCTFTLVKCIDLGLIEVSGNKGYYNVDSGTGQANISFDQHGLGRWMSKSRYRHGEFSVHMKFPSGYSAGVVATNYLISKGSSRDEVDFELLGNTDPTLVVIHTNFFSSGVGHHEEQFKVWYDPTDFHKYQVIWSSAHVVWLVDDIPIREYQFVDNMTVSKPMTWIGSVWDGSSWASRNKTSVIPINYKEGPFQAEYQNFTLNACQYDPHPVPGDCMDPTTTQTFAWDGRLSTSQREAMRRYRKNNLKYSYKYPADLPSSRSTELGAKVVPRVRYYRVRKTLLELASKQ